MSVLDRIGKSHLREYLAACASVSPINVELAYATTIQYMRSYDEGFANSIYVPRIDELKVKWYASLAQGTPDYSVYEDPYYFCEVWVCWTKYSRGYLKAINKDRHQYDNPSTVLDLGCGFGYTTAALKEIFPTAAVYGTNIRASDQWTLAEKLGVTHNFTLVDAASHIGHMDVVFASEYFEHFESPLAHLRTILVQYTPQYLIIANTFSGEAIGHFTDYLDMENQYKNGSEIGRLFNAMLVDYGYHQLHTDYWNNRPTVWYRESRAALTSHLSN